MNRIEVHLWVAAVLQWLIALSNVFAARIFGYRENIATLTPFVREVFIVQKEPEWLSTFPGMGCSWVQASRS